MSKKSQMFKENVVRILDLSITPTSNADYISVRRLSNAPYSIQNIQPYTTTTTS